MSIDNPENDREWRLYQQRELGDIKQTVTQVSTKLDDLITEVRGNGQPGRLAKVETRIQEFAEKQSNQRGVMGVIGTGVAIIMFALFKIFG